ncbi:MAG: GntR family transcriptional regulator [Deltaproteobacteria bacterium]|nr:GntR family transcriptional regulator [Deltaproteobacteria bacterium]
MPTSFRPLRTLEAPPSLKDMAFQEIKDAILANRLQPGGVYADKGLAEDLGISKTPVREALVDLTARGFFNCLHRKGFQLKVLTEEDIRNLFDFRSILELAIIRRITPTLSDEAIQTLEKIRRQEEKIAQTGERIKFIKIDRELHLYLVSLTNNPYLISSLENLRDLIDWTGYKMLSRPERPAEAMREHKNITDMLAIRDVEGAVGKMEEHIRITERLVISAISGTEDV